MPYFSRDAKSLTPFFRKYSGLVPRHGAEPSPRYGVLTRYFGSAHWVDG